MKKLLYIVVLLASFAMTVSSCTEEVVKPRDSGDNSGANTSNPKGS